MCSNLRVTLMESWWNGRWGTLGQERIHVYRTGSGWMVEHEGPRRAVTMTPCTGPEQARYEAARQRMESPGEWRRVDQIGAR